MSVESAASPNRGARRALGLSPFLLYLLQGLFGLAPARAAQVPQLPSASQAQQLLQQNPGLADIIRQRIQQSGMTPDQIRARLEASGYPRSLLDAYLGTTAGPPPTPGTLELAAIQALGLPSVSGPGLALDTGLISARSTPVPPESIAAGNYVFGVDAFRRSRTQFLPLLAGPVPPDYRLGPGDQLVLILTGDVELGYTLAVTREGFILVPQVGQIYVANVSLEQLRDILYARLGRVYSGLKRGPGATTRFDISVANVRANQVYVVGEVVQPGAYQMSALGTVLTALYAGGGVTARANMRQIEVRRLGKVVDTLDLYNYLLRGDTRSDVRLETGDVVFVPVHGVRAQVTGAVVRPAIYELRHEEKLTDLVRAAGGFRPNAALKRLAVHRILPPLNRSSATPPRTVIDIPLTAVAERTEAREGDDRESRIGGVVIPMLQLEDGDSVVVDTLPSLYGQYYVAIAGMVEKPGVYPWREGMTLRDLVLLARGPRIGADLREAEIARMPEDRSLGQLASTSRVPLDSSYLFNRDSLGRYVGPPGLAFPGHGASEVRLAPYDNVLILKEPEFDFQRTVTVVGEVRSPGVYSLRTKTDNLADIIARAGGLTKQAYPAGIRFIRTLNNVGRINADLTRALADTASRYNLILQPGDSINIPEYEPTVRVGGAVNSPGSVLWKNGEDLEYYLSGAGGLSYRADKGRVSVQYANGEVRTRHRTVFGTRDPRPGPGSEVFVPVRDTTQTVNYVALFGAIAQIVASTITIIYVIHHP